jgi:hypothetical protein
MLRTAGPHRDSGPQRPAIQIAQYAPAGAATMNLAPEDRYRESAAGTAQPAPEPALSGKAPGQARTPGEPAGNTPASWTEAEQGLIAGIDSSVPHSARIWNYWLGGKDAYPADRQAGEDYAELFPGIYDLARCCRYFTAREVRHLAVEAGIRQFLDIGIGMPFGDPVHEIAQRATHDDVRVVYADNDPLVLAHARALLNGPPGITSHIGADLNDPGTLLAHAGAHLDFSQPLAVLLMIITGHVGNPGHDDDQAACAVIGHLADALPPGSYLALADLAGTDPVQNAALRYYNQTGAVPYHARSPEQITRFFDGLELIGPGVVPVHQWRPDHDPFTTPSVPAWGAVAAKRPPPA